MQRWRGTGEEDGRRKLRETHRCMNNTVYVFQLPSIEILNVSYKIQIIAAFKQPAVTKINYQYLRGILIVIQNRSMVIHSYFIPTLRISSSISGGLILCKCMTVLTY